MPSTTTDRLFVRLAEDDLQGPEADIPPGALHSLPIAPALRPYVSHLLHYRESLAPDTAVTERVLPDGAVRLVFNLGDPPSAAGFPGWATEAIGSSIAPTVVRLAGRVDGVSVTLRPGAASALLGLPAGELRDQAVPLDWLWGAAASSVWQQLARAPDARSRGQVLTAALEQRLQRVPRADALAPRAVALLTRATGGRPIGEVASRLGVSERRLQQVFHHDVGVSPRAWRRLMRLHTCLRRLRHPRPAAWAETAADTGFYDQSHLANEFRALVGLSPTEFFDRATSGSSKTAAAPGAIVA